MSGEIDQAKGRAKQAVGDLTDDEELHTEGEVDEAAGKLKDKVGDVIDDVKERADDAVDALRDRTR